MIGFLKAFFSNEKSPAEQALLAAAQNGAPRDVLTVPGYEMDEAEEKSGGCGGCGNCHCGNAQTE